MSSNTRDVGGSASILVGTVTDKVMSHCCYRIVSGKYALHATANIPAAYKAAAGARTITIAYVACKVYATSQPTRSR